MQKTDAAIDAQGGGGSETSPAGNAMRADADGRPILIGGRCMQCATRTFPAYAVCPICISEDVQEEAMPRRGILYAFSTVHVGLQIWRKPFTVGYVDLDNGVRLFTHLRGAVTIGAQVELGRDTVGVAPDGVPIVSFVFEPVAS